ncbi:MAG: MgtC/SapB family protein [Planctomycetaceae bacterium]|jgi:uncharacterized membrane protein (DUF4010 family)|nr:MgtC/SapB family protein [Planctomycetaceae bacterium]MBT6483271.1 MgtC/SapB family protein [Planctomycetaceae bacterium]
MDLVPLFGQLAISLLLGLLVGLQRERTESNIAGFRTFPLITLFGTLSAILANAFDSPWIVGVGFVGVVALAVVGNFPKFQHDNSDKHDTGVTTEAAMLVMYAVGALVVVGPWEIAVAVGGTVAILLYLKPQLHGFASRLGDQDFRAILQFVLITFVILPVLPNQQYDPIAAVGPLLQPFFPNAVFPDFAILNPYEIWWLVVLVVGISMGAYVSYKLFGSRAGTVLGGVLGGLISSTATTVSYSRRSAQKPNLAALSASVIMIATTVTYLRVLLEIGIAGPSFLPTAIGPIGVLFVVSLVLSISTWVMGRQGEADMPEQSNPSEMKTAFIFAILYAVVLMAVAAGKAFFPGALYIVAILSGMTDMDAITLSTSRLVQSDALQSATGWRLIVTASMSNLAFKGAIVAFIGDRRLARQIAILFGISLLSGVAVLALW